jgi:hypothetical protein
MAWTVTTKNEYASVITAAAVAMAAAPVHSDVILDDLGEGGTIVGVDISIAGSAATCPLDLEASYDNVTFFKVGASAIADVVPAATGVKCFLIDSFGLNAPYYRLALNAASAAIGTTGRFKFLYSTKPSGAFAARSR